MKYLPYDDLVINAMDETELEEYIVTRENYGSQNWISDGYAIPFVTGHKYKIHWGLIGTNFEDMNILIPRAY